MNLIDHVEAFLFDVLQLQLLGPVKLLQLSDRHLVAGIFGSVIVETCLELFKLELRRLQELSEVVAELPDVQNLLEILSFNIDLHGPRLRLQESTVELRHLLDKCVGDRVSNRVAFHILWVKLSEDLELLLD